MNQKYYGITHFLRIPFATPESTPQFLQSLRHVSQDPIAAALPQAAWKTPNELYQSMGPLSLLKPGRLDGAIRLLRELDMDQIARAIAARSDTDIVTNSTCRSSGMVQAVQAPIISLQGLGLIPAYERTRELTCDVKGDRRWIEQFKLIVSKIFQDADLIRLSSPMSRPLCLKLMTTKYLRTDEPNTKPTLKGRNAFLQPSFDASDLFAKYRDFKWTTDFPLERLCISELGLKDIVRNGEVVGMGYRDIASVPLPGSVFRGALDGEINDTYKKAAKTIKKSHPVCPLVIPSSPPS